LWCFAVFSSVSPTEDVPKPEALTELIASLKAEAEETKRAGSSTLFTWLRDPKNASRLKLSETQVDLIRRTESLSRDIVCDWLLRDVEGATVVGPRILQERLSERGARHRSRLVAESEELVIQGVLTAEQVGFMTRALGRRAAKVESGHRGQLPPIVDAHQRTVPELTEALRSITEKVRTCGDVPLLLLGTPIVRALYPNGIEHLNDGHKAYARPQMPKVEVSARQKSLVERIDSLALAILTAWATRGLDKTPPPSQETLADRLYWSLRFNDNLAVHVEALIFQGVLSHEQAERCLLVLWKQMGYPALRDPALGKRLGLKKSQRDVVRDVLDAIDGIPTGRRSERLALRSAIPEGPELEQQFVQLELAVQERREQLDRALWDVLTPAQCRELEQILGESPPRRPAASKRKSQVSAD
jgi:hypothetical protein